MKKTINTSNLHSNESLNSKHRNQEVFAETMTNLDLTIENIPWDSPESFEEQENTFREFNESFDSIEQMLESKQLSFEELKLISQKLNSLDLIHQKLKSFSSRLQEVKFIIERLSPRFIQLRLDTIEQMIESSELTFEELVEISQALNSRLDTIKETLGEYLTFQGVRTITQELNTRILTLMDKIEAKEVASTEADLINTIQGELKEKINHTIDKAKKRYKAIEEEAADYLAFGGSSRELDRFRTQRTLARISQLIKNEKR